MEQSLTTDQDQELFERIKADSFEAYESVFRRYYQELYRFAYNYLREQVAAEEMTQEIFLYIWEKRQKIEIKTTLKTYLYSAIKNKCLNYIKYELPKKNTLEDSHFALMVTNQPEQDEDDEKLKRYIDEAINQLPTKCRQIFVLSRSGGMTYDEIAEELDISVKTVENQMTIALRKLREWLKPVYEYYQNR
jgi:RNA polymerase sigma-70 factor, ECF subfamily